MCLYASFASTAPGRTDYQYSATASTTRYPLNTEVAYTYIQIHLVYIYSYVY